MGTNLELVASLNIVHASHPDAIRLLFVPSTRELKRSTIQARVAASAGSFFFASRTGLAESLRAPQRSV